MVEPRVVLPLHALAAPLEPRLATGRAAIFLQVFLVYQELLKNQGSSIIKQSNLQQDDSTGRRPMASRADASGVKTPRSTTSLATGGGAI